MSISVVVWTGSECALYREFALLWVKPFGEEGRSRGSKSMGPEGVINALLVNIVRFGVCTAYFVFKWPARRNGKSDSSILFFLSFFLLFLK